MWFCYVYFVFFVSLLCCKFCGLGCFFWIGVSSSMGYLRVGCALFPKGIVCLFFGVKFLYCFGGIYKYLIVFCLFLYSIKRYFWSVVRRGRFVLCPY